MIEDHSYAEIFPLLEGEDFEQLVDDIKDNGLIHPITLLENKVLDGRNRYRACLQAEVEPKFAEFSGNDAISFVISCNASRRDLTASQRACAAVNAEQLVNRLQKEAKERQKELGKSHGLGPSGKNSLRGRPRDFLAKRFRVNSRYVEDAFVIKRLRREIEKLTLKPELEWKELVQKCNGLSDLFNEVLSGKKTLADAKRERDRFDYDKRVVEAALKKTEVPQVVLADPPWQYEKGSTTTSREIENQYDTLTVEDIIAQIPTTAPDAVLFLWATQPLLRQALDVINAWGFEYKTGAIWDKEVIGMGYWFRIQHELLLVGVKGKVPPPAEFLRVSSIFREKRTEHSKKPLCVYEWIEKAFPTERKLEMYARKAREGWGIQANEL